MREPFSLSSVSGGANRGGGRKRCGVLTAWLVVCTEGRSTIRTVLWPCGRTARKRG
ncbi:hypothetical protein SKAU_G00116140 [Synaphobranchus kaupii]|uniref:Uncharacterized protein n=1 Tax=Synaphobranchus kaupii TaxID=118154 RepID=A0A9Q1FND8_SYNKA|nr:hypothetical protein SKAU_G00116140 [Synaphobranchus kaupii]